MKIQTYTCHELRYNRNMGMECIDHKISPGGYKTIFFIDTKNWVKVGDIVKCEKDEKGFDLRIWVNDVLKTEDHFKDIHGVSAR